MSYNTAENDFAMIVRGINSLINNANTLHDNDGTKFNKIIRRAQGQVVQTGKFAESQPQVVFEGAIKRDLGVKGVGKNIKRKSYVKEGRNSNQRKSS
jgi:hypothetical protein